MTDPERLHELCRLRSTLEAFAVRRWPRGAARSNLERALRNRLAELKQVRLERAAQLLCSSADAVAAVARRVGYRNVSHFVRDFRRMFGVTPLAYRRRGDR